MKKLFLVFFIIFCTLILGLSLRGLPGNPTSQDLNTPKWEDNGPFELSPERGRFALIYSVWEDRSFLYSEQIGQFSKPDVAVSQGRFVSLFAPGVSFISLPGYILGRYFNLSQVGSYAFIAIFAILNGLLIRVVSIKLGANSLAATIGVLAFLFASPAFAYGVNLYQHHISTFLILLGIYALTHFNNSWSLLLVFFLCGAALPIDNPNLVFVAPLSFYAAGRTFTVYQQQGKLNIKLSLQRLATILIVILPIIFFLWFNKMSYGNSLQLSGTLQTSKSIEAKSNNQSISGLQSQTKKEKTAVGFFQTRFLLNGFYTQFFSPDRGMLIFTPVMLFGFLGLFLSCQRKVKFLSLFVLILGTNVLLYSMWGDPYGGWAFGSRYLIPSYAILAIFIGLFLTYLKKYWLILTAFFVIFVYSVAVNTLGAITTSTNPPKVEIASLEKITGKKERFSFDRNFEYLMNTGSKSFIYQAVIYKYLTAWQFYYILTFLISFFGLAVLINLHRVEES